MSKHNEMFSIVRQICVDSLSLLYCPIKSQVCWLLNTAYFKKKAESKNHKRRKFWDTPGLPVIGKKPYLLLQQQ